jgi:hypothetical protein
MFNPACSNILSESLQCSKSSRRIKVGTTGRSLASKFRHSYFIQYSEHRGGFKKKRWPFGKVNGAEFIRIFAYDGYGRSLPESPDKILHIQRVEEVRSMGIGNLYNYTKFKELGQRVI